ncbi:3-ketoacyl-CoA thiolase [Cylindrobasidium torrendii FP15055 ss-10]|uniref:3-ketoacyl-CoA thiolase n=1 Tax=Cylindrobasidium torrendii FP15055 ss-10 TaxID=1314674 RepID=A0A0D7BFR9_9AGAR|nr:3-ketoacyl-CoA thiolase [Cylindrobasidium torrendii FP15055 ss-10]
MLSSPIRIASRSASTQVLPRGLAAITQKNPDDVVITFAKRTAMGRAKKGQLKDTTVDELLQALFKASLASAKIDTAKIDDICVGVCHPPSPLYISRAAALAAGIHNHVPISTVNRLCSSGLMAIRNTAHAIKSGEVTLGLAVGVESMSTDPRPDPKVSEPVDAHKEPHDCIQPMGWTSEMVAEHYNVPREKQDAYALISHSRAIQAFKAGVFKDEILPIDIRGQTIDTDDTIRLTTTADSLKGLKPVFPNWGSTPSTTAGNASGVGDGAALCVMTTRANAEKEGLTVVAKFVGTSVVGVEPRFMGISPVVAIPKLLAQHGLTKDGIDVYEINEAFASQFAYCVEELGVSMDKINPNGGSIAISHPLGMTGVRQVVTGLQHLKRMNQQVLLTSMCVGSGMGAAGLFVNES